MNKGLKNTTYYDPSPLGLNPASQRRAMSAGAPATTDPWVKKINQGKPDVHKKKFSFILKLCKFALFASFYWFHFLK
jgi:hypothetical protein